MNRRDDKVYLQHVLDAILAIERFTGGVTYEQFVRNEMMQQAVVRELEIVGEAGRNLSEEFRTQHPEIPWREIIGMRNRIIHAYFDLDLGAVWDAVQLDVPTLKLQIETILRHM